jgi:hypothetical protein
LTPAGRLQKRRSCRDDRLNQLWSIAVVMLAVIIEL